MFFEKSHTGNNKWYLYVLTILITFLATQLGSLPLAAYALFTSDTPANIDIATITNTNIGLSLMLLSFAIGLVALLWCVKSIHNKKIGDVLTARTYFDRTRFFWGAAVWAMLSVASFALEYWLGDTSDIVFQFQPAKFFPLLLIVALFLPLQTSFEEVFFRGYLMQGSFLLLRSKWGALIITSLIFGLMHIANPEVTEFGFWVTMPQYVLMGLFFGYLTIKDNGLELALGVHAANNIMACTLITSNASALQTAALFKDMNPTVTHWDTLSLLIFAVVFVSMAHWKFNRKQNC
ncbi:abortive infection protein [Bacteroidia bacterium]|nr:abortive infection protein [Bacteroidia bacterium]